MSAAGPAPPVSPQSLLDAERHALPATLLLLGTVSVALLGAASWIGLWTTVTMGSAALRWLVARWSEPRSAAGAARAVTGLHLIDVGAWTALLLWAPPAVGSNGIGAAGAAAAALLASIALRYVGRLCSLAMAGWAVSAVLVMWNVTVAPIFIIGFPLWLLAVWWSARAPSAADMPLPETVTAAAPAEPEPAAPPDAAPDRAAELYARLPGLVWNVDAHGHVTEVRGDAPWRWGLRIGPYERPHWAEAFGFDEESRASVERAVARAIAGQSTFDVLNRRRTRLGALVALRSHFVPFSSEPSDAVGQSNASALVLDTIAAPHELIEVEQLRRSRAHYKSLVDASASLIWACDEHFRITFASRRATREIYRCEPHHLVGRPVSKLLAEGADQGAALRALAGLRAGESLRDVEMVHGALDGTRVVVALTAAPLRTRDGAFQGAVGTVTDLTIVKQRESRLAEALQVERTVLDAAGEAIAVVKGGRVLRCNDAFMRLLKAEPAHLARASLAEYFEREEDWNEIAGAAELARGEDRATVKEVQIRRGARKDTESMWCQVTARMVAPDEVVIVLVDIDQIRRRETDALHVAHHDELTGLPNRRMLATRAQPALAAAAGGRAVCAVLALDLDGFKAINDRYGHRMGDVVLREIAHRLQRAVRPQDTVARRGGDEFAVLLPDVGSRIDAERVASRLLHAVGQPLILTGGREGWVSASIGIALAPQQGIDLERLLQVADAAMYHAKLRGKNRYEFPVDAAHEGPRAAASH
ncbi:MAG: diguanylate cyclase domain-containing protein [Gemmatimonadota bacterium]